MKKRYGFVSNSSSSSFICCVSNESVEIDDSCDIGDYGLVRCENNHVFFTEYVVNKENLNDDSYTQNKYEEIVLKECHCPLCSLSIIKDNVLLDYILFKYSLNKETLVNEIKRDYTSLNHFKKVLEDKED